MKTLTCRVTEADEGRLVWRVVRSRMSVSSHQLARAKVLDGLKLNGESVHADVRVKTDDVLTVQLFDDAPEFTVTPENAPVSVVYEDEDIIVIDKPAPLATQSSPRQPDNTLENRLAYYFRDTPGFIFRPVNRLDKGTSGLMCAAKHQHAQMIMSRALHTDSFVREYLAVTDGIPEPLTGVIDKPIGKSGEASVRRVIAPDGKPSVTHYTVLEAHGALALVRLRLETGRTHQIRVHLSSIGCPVYGDFLYGREEPEALPERFALHSAYTRFIHPLSGREMEFSSPLPAELQRILEQEQHT